MKLTPTNLYALREQMKGATRVPNQVDAVSAPHLRRCIKLGLLRVGGKELVLAEAGVEALGG